MHRLCAPVEQMPGFGRPVFDSQATFRALLKAMAHPGTVVTIPVKLQPPSGLHTAAAAVALTLFDLDTPVWTDLPQDADVLNWLRFHCGNPFCRQPHEAAFALITQPQSMPPLDCCGPGSDDHPEYATTLILQIEALEEHRGLELHGPGIQNGGARVYLGGLTENFWRQRRALQNCFPCGLDMVFTHGCRLTALPRTTRVKG